MPFLGKSVLFLFGVAVGVVGTLLALAAGVFDPLPLIPGLAWGKFSATPKVEMLDDGRKLKLIEDFVYVDREGKEWRAETGHVVDGASIPQIFWTVTEGPLEGKFRNASICHDVECDKKREPWEAVHLMFYEACRCGGVPENKAKMLYTAVYLYGPRWQKLTEQRMVAETGPDGNPRNKVVEVTVIRDIPPEIPPADMQEKLQKYIAEQNPSIEQLKLLSPKNLSRQ